MKPMSRPIGSKIHHQAVGAFGEKATEAELLRHGWIPSNVNSTVKNLADFDIFALKGKSTVHLRVKACSPREKAFQWSFARGKEIKIDKLRESDFTVLVRMGDDRRSDNFWIVPTRTVWQQLMEHRRSYLRKLKRDGKKRLDDGHWVLHLQKMRSGEARESHGFEEKWKAYLDNWDLLDRPIEEYGRVKR